MEFYSYMDLLGKPFVRGGRGPNEYDCYGLVREMFKRSGREVPDFTSPGTLEEIEELMAHSLEEARWVRVEPRTIGALITFRVEGMGAHVGYMLSDDRFLHTTEATGVTTERLTNGGFRPLAFYDYR